MESPQHTNTTDRAQSPNPSKGDRKRKRATRACLSCRARKVRCDVMESKTTCTNCRLDSLECVIGARKQTRPMWNDGLRRNRRRKGSVEDNNAPILGLLSNREPENGSSPTANADGSEAGEPAGPVAPSQEVCERRVADEKHITDTATRKDDARHGTRTLGNARCLADYQQVRECEAIEMDVTRPPTSRMETSSGSVLPAYIKPLPDSLSRDDIDYLRRKGALTIPENPLLARLLQGFIEYVYGYMPLLDLKELLQAIELGGTESAPRVSLLLFQAIMFAGAAFVDMADLRAAGYRSRRAARKELFERVEILHRFNIERSNITIIQSVLLMTHWYYDETSHKDLWRYMGTVTTLSQMSALHKDPGHHELPLREQRMRKRLGWCVFMRDQILAFGMRRPAHIQPDGHTIPILSLEDFECDSLETTALPPDCTVVRDAIQRRQLATFCIEKCKLCVCIGLVLSSQYRPTAKVLPGDDGPILMLKPKPDALAENQTDGCSQQLERWKRHLPIMCMYDSTSALSACESRVMVIHKALLKMMYLTVVAALYRPHIMPFSPWSSATSPIVKGASSLQAVSRTKLRSAASEICAIGHDLQSLDLVHYLPTSSVTVFLPALIVHLMHIAYGGEEVVVHSMQQFSSVMTILTLLSKSYASAELAVHFLENIINASSLRISQNARLLHPSPPSEPKDWHQQRSPTPSAYNYLGDQKGRTRSLDDSVPSRKRRRWSEEFKHLANDNLWPEWTFWLDGDCLMPSVPGSNTSALRRSHWDLNGDSHETNADVTPVLEDVEFSSADMPEVWSDFKRDVLGWEAELGDLRLPANGTNELLEISPFLNENALPEFPEAADSIGLDCVLFSPTMDLEVSTSQIISWMFWCC